jgi:hypothetical protein
MRPWALDPLEADFNEPALVTFGHSPIEGWTILSFAPPETVAFAWEPSAARALCHAMIERLPATALAELLRSIEELDEYYSRPVSVAPTKHTRTVTTVQGEKHAPPVLDLTES